MKEIDTLIQKYLDKTILESELNALNNWKNASADNEKYFKDLQLIYNTSKINTTFDFDTDKAWQKVFNKINEETSVIPMYGQKVKNQRKWVYGIAASAAAIFVTVASALFINNSTDSSNISITKLKDGSKIELSDNSLLQEIKNREFAFKGHGKFNIIHDSKSPFVVKLGEIEVKDLGTIFTINNLPNDDTIFVDVQEGEVQLYSKYSDGILLNEGESGGFIKSRNTFYKNGSELPITLTYKFDNQSLENVINVLNKHFKKRIELRNSNLANCKITASFKNESLKTTLDVIIDTLDLWLIEKDNIILIGGDCNAK